MSDADNNHTVEKAEFPAFILHMASVDLRNRQTGAQTLDEARCTSLHPKAILCPNSAIVLITSCIN